MPPNEQMNNCEVTDGPLADHCETVVIAESGPCSTDFNEICNIQVLGLISGKNGFLGIFTQNVLPAH